MTGILISGYLLLLLLANFTPAQRWLAGVAEDALSSRLHTEVSIGRFELGLFNRIVLHEVSVSDRHGAVLLSADLLSAKIEYAPLLSGRVALRSVSLLDGNVKLYRRSADESPNFQFVLDAFKSDKKGPSRLNLSLNSLILRRCNVSYDEHFRPETPGRFNASHIGVSGIDANISLKTLTPDSINLRVRSFALREKSGLDVRSLSFRLAAGLRNAAVSRLELQLPSTRITEDRIEARYDVTSDKPLLSTMTLIGDLNEATVAFEDLACFFPELHDYPYAIALSADFRIRQSQINVPRIRFRETAGRVLLEGEAAVNLSDGQPVQATAAVERFSVQEGAASGMLGKLLPEEMAGMLDRAGNIGFSGRARMQRGGENYADGELMTAAGVLRASLHWRGDDYTARLSSDGFSPSVILERPALPQNVAFSADMKARLSEKRLRSASAALQIDRAEYSGYTFQGIQANAAWDGRCLQAELLSPDDNLDISARLKGAFNGKRFHSLDFEADVNNVWPQILGLSGASARARYAGHVSGAFPVLGGVETQGVLQVRDFAKVTPGDTAGFYRLSQLRLAVAPSELGTKVTLDSDFAEAEADGQPSSAAFLSAVSSLLAQALPGILPDAPAAQPAGKTSGVQRTPAQWKFSAAFYRPDFFSKVLGLPVDFGGDVIVQGHLSEPGLRSSVMALAGHLTYGSTAFTDLRCYLSGDQGDLSALVQAEKRMGKADMRFELNARTANGQLQGDLTWDDDGRQRFAGQLQTLTGFSRSLHGGLQFSTQILPTRMTIADTLWHIHPGSVSLDDGTLRVDGIKVSHDDQSLAVTGGFSKTASSDSLAVRLQKIDVSYILSLINLKPVSFAGQATGTLIAAPTAAGGFSVGGTLDIPKFYFNDGLMGHALIKGRFNTADKRLHLDADMQERGVGSTLVSGYVGIGENGLDLRVRSKNTTLHFLRRYVSHIFGDISGRTTGYCRIYGPFKALDFEGHEEASLYARILATGCGYHLSGGRVNIKAGQFGFENYTVTDDFGGSGSVGGYLRHRHLKDIRYDFNVHTRSLQLYSKGKSMDLPFYATAYGTGTARLYGQPGRFSADMNIRPDGGTLFVYTVDNPETAYDVSLLRFGEKHHPGETAASHHFTDDRSGGGKLPVSLQEAEATTDINLNFQIDMSPEARLRVIMDEKSGDNIELAGTGALRATYYNKGAFQMFGTYNVERGSYKMAIQEVIHKDFQFQPGGAVVFGGDPYDGDLRLKAVYTVPSVSLADLGFNFVDKPQRADCVLNLHGRVKAPEITFDLSLPTASDEVKQMVRQLISTEEDMNMQILYLLGVGRFYNYNFAATEAAAGGQAQSSVAMKSFLSNTLSGQLNNIISNAVGASNWTFGANLSTGEVGWSDMEVAGLLSGRLLNNRLLVNGNFGYRDRTTSTTNFVGDFDINYLLTPSGSVSLKAYSETNDRYFSKSSMTTQGIGILLKRDFNSFRDFFSPRRRVQQYNADTLRTDTAAAAPAIAPRP